MASTQPIIQAANGMEKRGRGRPRKSARPKGDDLMQAAKKLFLLHPYTEVTTRAVAVEAGVDCALIRYYFGNKEGLYKATVTELYENAMKRLRHFSNRSEAPSIDELFTTFFETNSAYPELVLLMFRTIALNDGPCRDFLITEIVDPLNELMVRVFRRLRDEGVTDPSMNPEMLRLSFDSLCLMPWFLRPMLTSHMSDDEANEQIRAVFGHNSALFSRAVAAGTQTSPR